MPSSSQTVLSSRTVPSRVTCTRPLLRPPERRKKARKSRSSQLPFHLPGKRIVVRDLLFDLHELVVQATAFVVHAPKRLDEASFALSPPLDLALRGLRPCQRHPTAPVHSSDAWCRPGPPPASRSLPPRPSRSNPAPRPAPPSEARGDAAAPGAPGARAGHPRPHHSAP